MSDLTYAKNIFKLNPIRPSELNYYAGKVKGKKPHGIDNKIWKQAYSWAKKTGNLTVDN